MQAYQVFSLPLSECCVPWVLEMLLHKDFAFISARAQEFHNFYVKFLGLGILYLRIIEIWISHCTGLRFWFLTGNPFPPPLTTMDQNPGKTKSFNVASPGCLGILLPALYLSWAQRNVFHICKDVKPPAKLHPASVQNSLLSKWGQTGLFQFG